MWVMGEVVVWMTYGEGRCRFEAGSVVMSRLRLDRMPAFNVIPIYIKPTGSLFA